MPVKVYFGENSVKQRLKNTLKHYKNNTMITHGNGLVKINKIYDEVTHVLKDCGKNIIGFSNITANPTYGKVLERIKLYKENDVILVLAVVVESIIDCCKIIFAKTLVEPYAKFVIEDFKYIISVPYKILCQTFLIV